MRQTLVPVLLLVAVALSSSKVLPLLSTSQLRSQLLGIEGQENDNTHSFREKNNNILNNLFYNIPVDTPDYIQRDSDKSHISYSNMDNVRSEYNFNVIKKKDNRNGEGFRKEQWHNYPRQMDRLHKYINEQPNYDKGIIDTGEIIGNDVDADDQFKTLDDETNEFKRHTKLDTEIANELTPINSDTYPILNLKLPLGSSRNNYLDENINPEQERNLDTVGLKKQNKEIFINYLQAIMDVIRNVRTRESSRDSDITDDTLEENKTVTKRIFSFWSRVQGLNHKGHEILQRRRHMHTFYAMPDGDGNRVLTAETRAILMRPPGSPLRWG